ncbi:hypothetical protein N2152v2_003472 [Parachlorella kessleri]
MADQNPGGPSRSPDPHAVRQEAVPNPPHQFLASGPASQQHTEPRQQPQAYNPPGLPPVGWGQWARQEEEMGGGAATGAGPAGDWGGGPATYGDMASPPERLLQLLAALQQVTQHDAGVAQQATTTGQPREPLKGAAAAAVAAAQPQSVFAPHPMGQRRQELEQLWAAYGGTAPEDTQRFVAALQHQQQQHRRRGGQAGGEEEEQQESVALHGLAPGSGKGDDTEGASPPDPGAGPHPTPADPIAPSPFLGRGIPGYQPRGPQHPVLAHQEQQQQQQGDSTAMLMVPTLPLEERPARSTSLNFQMESSSFSLPLPQPSLPQQPVLRPSPAPGQQGQQQEQVQQQQQEQQLAVQAGGTGGAQARSGTPAIQAALTSPQPQLPAPQPKPAAGAEGGAVGCSDGRHCPGDEQEEEPLAASQPAAQPATGVEGLPAQQQAVVHGAPQQQQQQQQPEAQVQAGIPPPSPLQPSEGAAAGALAGSWEGGIEPTLNPAGHPSAPHLRQVAPDSGLAAAAVEAQPPAAAAVAVPAAAGEVSGTQLAANPHLQLLRVLFSIQVHIEAALLGVQAAVSAEVPKLSEQVAVLGQLQTQEDPWLQQLAAAILRILQSVQQWVSTLAPTPAAALPALQESQRAPQLLQQAEQGAPPHPGPRLHLAAPPRVRGDAETAAEALVSFMSANPAPSGEKSPSARPVSGQQLPGPALAAAAAQQAQQQLEQQAEQQQRQLQQQAQLEQLLVARAVHKRRAEEAAATQEGAAAEDVWGPPPKRALTQSLMWARRPFPGSGQGGQEPAGAEGQQMSPAEAATAYGQQQAVQEYFPTAGDPSQGAGSPTAYLQALRQRLALLQQHQHQQGALPPAAPPAWAPQQPAAPGPPPYQQAEAPPALSPQFGPQWGGPREAAVAQAYQQHLAAQHAAAQGVPPHGYGYPSPVQLPQQGWFPPHQLAYQQPPPALAPQQPAADLPEPGPWDLVRLRTLLHHQQLQQLQQQWQGEAEAAFRQGHAQLPAAAPVAPGLHQAPLQWPQQQQQQQQPLWEGPAVDHLRLRVAAVAAALGSAAGPPGMGWDEQHALHAAAGGPRPPAGMQGAGGWVSTSPVGPQVGQPQVREDFYMPRAGLVGGPGGLQQQPLPSRYPPVAAAEPSSARAPAAQSGWAAPPQLTPTLAPAGYPPWGTAQQVGQGGGAAAAQQGVPTDQLPPPPQQGQQEEEAGSEEAAAVAAQLRAVLARYLAHGPPGPGS